MHASNLFLSLVAPAVALGIALDDFANLQTLFRTTSADILDTVIFTNGTSRGYGSNATVIPYSVALSTPYDTAGAIRQCSMSIQDSEDDATSDLTAFVNGAGSAPLNVAYVNFMDEVRSLGQAVVARGRAWHADDNREVFQNLQSLASTISAYASALQQRSVINDDSMVRTRSSTSALINAESAWEASGSLPSRRSPARRRVV